LAQNETGRTCGSPASKAEAASGIAAFAPVPEQKIAAKAMSPTRENVFNIVRVPSFQCMVKIPTPEQIKQSAPGFARKSTNLFNR
jgi:hypothetical protein